MDEQPRQVPGMGIYLLVCAAAALWADLGTLHRLQHGDSLLPVLVSLQHWTPFFWEQDRYGMLIPLLARPLTHPFANLLFQGFLDVFCGLSAFFLLPRYIRPGPSSPLAGALAASSFLTLAPAPYRFDYLMDANYGVWLVLGLGALIVAEPRPGEPSKSPARLLAALVMMMLAHWVYRATALYLGTLVVFRMLLAPGFRREMTEALRRVSRTPRGLSDAAARAARSGPGQALLLLSAGYAVGTALTGLARHHPTSYASLPMGRWPHAWARLAEETGKALAPGLWPLALITTAGLVLLLRVVPAARRGASPPVPWREAAALLATALGVALFVGTKSWLFLNAYAPRYLLPSVFFAQGALALLIVEPLRRPLGAGGRGEPLRIAALLLVSVAWAYGLPSPARVRADLDRFGGRTADVIASGCTYVAGDYWTVWPTVFHVLLTLHERGDARSVWGVTFRGQPTSTIWWNTPQSERCVCIPAGDPYGDNWLRAFGFGRFQDVERRATVRVLRRRPTPAAAAPDP